MKSLFLFASLLLLASCGKEQFGTAAQSESTQVSGKESFSQASCTSHTLIQPKVDILYIVDNSTSTYYVPENIKTTIRKTLDSISNQFDYRIVGIPLMPTTASNHFTNFQVLTKSTENLPSGVVPISSTSEFSFFSSTASGSNESGVKRATSFISHHSTTGLFRNGAYHLIILISNGRDKDLEKYREPYNGQVIQNENEFAARLSEFATIRSTLSSQQLRFFSVTASSVCQDDWLSSTLSYQAISKRLYNLAGATDSATQDVYDLCQSGLSKVFEGVNKSIQQVVVPHSYRYLPITFAENNETVDIDKIKVIKISNGSPSIMATTEWQYHPNTSNTTPLNTRELPSIGEPKTGKHFVKFNNLLTYPDCVQITSESKLEYFGYAVIPRPAKKESILVKINGQEIPKGAIDYEGYKANINIKVSKNNSSTSPAVYRSGYFIKITNPTYFYKSGDSVDVYYTPDSI